MEDPWEHLLVYLTAYKLIICKQCKFAVQPDAIPRHLKDRHHIFRERRHRLLKWVGGLALLRPEHVSPPPPTQPPICHLGLESGLSCTSQRCRYLCVSVKRMKQHWTTQHGRSGIAVKDWRSVNLQTFFRGKCSHYFVVGANVEELKSSLRSTSQPDCPPPEDGAFTPTDPSDPGLSTEQDGTFVNVEHFKLFKHYVSSTHLTMYHQGEPAGFWNNTVVEIGFQYPYLLHGLLSMSALHLAYLHEEQKEYYILTARHHQNVALPLFRSNLQTITDENCHAVLIFSRLQAVYTLASSRLSGLSIALRSPDNQDPIETWLRLFRGNTTLWSTTMSSLREGPAACLISRPALAAASTDFSDSRVQQLRCEIHTIYSGAEGLEELHTCLDTADELERALAHVSGSSNPARFWEAIEHWVCHLSDLYLHMAIMRRPAALVLLAHACMLLKHVESFWYVGDHAAQLLQLIGSRLDPLHQCLLLWPIRMIEPVGVNSLEGSG